MKGKLVAVLTVLALFIPAYIAAGSYLIARNSPVTEKAVSKMIITDFDGNTYTFDRNAEDDSGLLDNTTAADMIRSFIRLNEKAQRVSNLPAPLVGADCYTVDYFSYNLDTQYRYYFTTDPSSAYYVDNKDNAYRIASLDAQSFISSQYAVGLYKDAAAPVLKLGSGSSAGETVLPQTMSWKYKLNNDAYNDAVVPLAKEKPTEVISGALKLEFDVEPDYLYVQLYNDSEMVYNGLYSAMDDRYFSESTRYTVTVNAQWYESEERGSYGEAVYTFVADVRAPAVFYLSESTLEPGDFVAVVGKNVTDPAAVTFASEPEINFTPVFFQDGENVVALVPISYELAYSPSYEFTVTSEGVSTTLTLNVTKKEFKWRDYPVTSELITTTRTAAALTAFDEFMAEYLAYQEPTRYWTPSTLFTQPTNADVKTGIGVYRTITINGETYDQYRHPGVDFMVAAGSSVQAACAGRVVYVGQQTLSGRIVVIEHGFGLKSIYCHMSSVTVSSGQTVKAGDVLGVVGSTGFTNSTNLHFGLYVFGTPVSPYKLFGWDGGTGITVMKP